MTSQISSAEELHAELGDQFVILCGSAIAATTPAGDPFLPMVNTVMTDFFAQVASRLSTGSYYYRLTAGYAAAISRLGAPYNPLLYQTKFEDFIARIEGATSTDKATSLLRALFECSADEFNFNHAAIWHLLKARRAKMCITTNFDNAIESASAGSLRRYIGYDFPAAVPDQPAILKPHGDVVAGMFIATTELLYSGSQQRRFDGLGSLLENETVLVVGYSGTGDVDIAPSLHKAAVEGGARFIWTIEPKARVDSAPEYASVAAFDLFERASERNWLLHIADRCGASLFRQREGPKWRERLRQWFDCFSPDTVADFVATFFAGRVGWPLNHLLQIREWSFPSATVNPLSRGRALIEIPDYRAAMKRFDEAAILADDDPRVRRWRGFCRWRMGEEDEALAILRPLAVSPSVNERSRTDTAAGRRHYLEVVRDRLRRSRSHALRVSMQGKYDVGKVRSLFLGEKESVSYEEALLTDIVLADLDRLMETPSEECMQTVRASHRMAEALRNRNATGSAARLLALMDRRGGLQLLRSTGVFGRSYYNLQSLRKSLVVVAAGVLPKTWEWVLFDFCDGRVSAKAHLLWMRGLSAWRLRKWRRAFDNDKMVFENGGDPLLWIVER